MTAAPEPNFDHLAHMTDSRGTFEHAELSEPRPEHGYCTDDMARLLVVAARQPNPTSAVSRLAGFSLQFLTKAQSLDGGFRNRMDRAGKWEDEPSMEDCWGRSIWGLGTAMARSDAEFVRQTAAVHFDRAARQRSPHTRAMAFAALGAAEVLVDKPDHDGARRLLGDAADAMPSPRSGGGTNDRSWLWPEDRLAYANAAIPEAMIAAGQLLDRPSMLEQGLVLLAWLLAHEMLGDHLSVTPAGGSGDGDVRPSFDQQPIEVAALADACARASLVDATRPWDVGLAAAVAWFLGDNDGSTVMYDPVTGGGFDGLRSDGANLNQGTESTLALLSTLQHASRVPQGLS